MKKQLQSLEKMPEFWVCRDKDGAEYVFKTREAMQASEVEFGKFQFVLPLILKSSYDYLMGCFMDEVAVNQSLKHEIDRLKSQK